MQKLYNMELSNQNYQEKSKEVIKLFPQASKGALKNISKIQLAKPTSIDLNSSNTGNSLLHDLKGNESYMFTSQTGEFNMQTHKGRSLS
jgi:hypothetical protein